MPLTEVFADSPSGTVSAGGTTAPAQGTSETWTVSVAASFAAAVSGSQHFYAADPALPGEVVEVTSCPGGLGSQSWTVLRGADGTVPAAHAAGFTVVQVIAGASLRALAPLAGDLGGTPASPQVVSTHLPVTTVASASGPVTLDPTTARVFKVTLTGSTTFTFGGTAVAGVSTAFSLYLAQDATGGRAVTWPGSVTWLGGVAPVLPTAASSVTLLVFETIDGGTTWYSSAVQELPALPLSVSNGGTGAAGQQAAINALAGTQSAGKYLRSDGTNTTLAAIAAADVPGVAGVTVSGTPSSGQVLTATSSSAANWAAASGGGGGYGGAFGDGFDGALAFNGSSTITLGDGTTIVPSSNVYTLPRDTYASSVTISSGVTVLVNGYPMFCSGTFSNAGTVSAAGVNASGATAGGGQPANQLGGSFAGGNGSTTTGNNPVLPSAGEQCQGGNGAGGGSGSSGAGGTGSFFGNFPSLLHQVRYLLVGSLQFALLSVPVGGQGGGGGGGDSSNSGGGGGGGGGIVAIWARTFTNTGTVTAKGGNGANGAGGNSGGGGGGGGGVVAVYSASAWTQGTVIVAGGSAGSGTGSGTSGSSGAAGNALNVVVA